MNISKAEQRTLHALAQGGRIVVVRGDHKTLIGVECLTRDGWRLADCTPGVFARLKRRGLIHSRDGQPYGISRLGLERLRPQLDNRVTAKRC